ncbi:MAG: SDR family oxidoreductase [Firmicutes bacterium]|nr:SDR family oxidoreductase [Bacillota bacterium]
MTGLPYLAPKTVLITGAGGGIGGEIARGFAKLGYTLVLAYNNSEKECLSLCEELKGQCLTYAFKADLSNGEGIDSLVDFCKKSIGYPEILINNAGISLIAPLNEVSGEDIDLLLKTNLYAPIKLTKAFYDKLLLNERGLGRIINISSVWGISGGSCEAVYSASKAGLIGFTKALSKEIGLYGTTVNCIAPGYIETAMNNALSESEKENIIKDIPMRRAGTPKDIADSVLFLASENAKYITGEVLSVSGGWK